MKKLLVLLLAAVMLIPVGALAQQANSPYITITYNGQDYPYTWTSMPKCCNEGDNSHHLIFKPVEENELGSVTLMFTTRVETGTEYRLQKGGAVDKLIFYANTPTGTRNYLSLPGSLLGNGLVGDEDHFELIFHKVDLITGTAHVDASLTGTFLNGNETFEIHFQVPLLMT